MNLKKVVGTSFLLLGFFFVVGCGKTSISSNIDSSSNITSSSSDSNSSTNSSSNNSSNSSIVTETGIEVSTQPTKTTYYVGEVFDKTGMIVKVINSDNTQAEITNYTVTSTPLVVNNSFITVTYKDFTAKVDIIVTPITPVDMEISSLPVKRIYSSGESFDSTGMIVRVINNNDSKVAITNYSIDKTVLSASDNKVVVSYETFTKEVAIFVQSKVVSNVEISVDEDMISAGNLTLSAISYRAIYSDGTKDTEWDKVTNEDYVNYAIEGSELKINLSLLVKNREFERQITINMGSPIQTVSTLLEKNPGETYMLEGTLVAITTTISRAEYIIIDDNGKMIGIAGLNGSGAINDYTLDTNGYAIGDKIRVPVQLVATATLSQNSDSNKVYAQIVSNGVIEPEILSHDNIYAINKSEAVTISNQAELTNFLSAANRNDNFYKVVRLTGKLNYVCYSGKQYRFFFDDSITSLAAQKIDNCSPCFCNGSQYYTTDCMFGELIGKSSDFNPTSWTNPEKSFKDIYAVFIGGNTYYHEFVILSSLDVTDAELKLDCIALNNPDTLTYSIGSSFDLTGAYLNCSYEYGVKKTVPVTMSMLDAATIPTMNLAGNYTIKGSYLGKDFSFSILITNKVAESIVLKSNLLKAEYHVRDWQAAVATELEKMQIDVTYTDLSTESIDILNTMINCDKTYSLGLHNVEVSYLGATVIVPITLVNQALSVSDIKVKEAGSTVYELTGIVVSSAFISGTASEPLNGELLIKEKNSNAVIGIKNTGISKSNKLASLNVGDEIVVSVSMIVTCTSANYSEYNKVAPSLVSGSEILVVSSDNSINLDKSQAISITNQTELAALLTNDEDRLNNLYKLIKISSDAKLVNFNSTNNSLYITFSATALSGVKIDGLSPYLHVMNESMTLGESTYLDTIFGEDATNNTSFSTPNVLRGDLYLMYIGGQGAYYHQFILLGADYVTIDA